MKTLLELFHLRSNLIQNSRWQRAKVIRLSFIPLSQNATVKIKETSEIFSKMVYLPTN